MSRHDRIRQLYAPTKHDMHADRIAVLKGRYIHITYRKNFEVTELVRRIHERRFESGKHDVVLEWTAPVTLDAVDKLRKANFNLSENLIKWEKSILCAPRLTDDFWVSGLKHKLFPYQLDGVEMIEWWDGRCLLADDQGLGKTPEVLAWLTYRPELRPVLIICPANLKLNWVTEFNFWLENPRVQVINGNTPVDIWGDFVIINYDILAQIKNNKDVIRPDIWKVLWEVIVMDEAHYINDRGVVKYDEDGVATNETIRSWAVKELCRGVEHIIAVTATPGKHRPRDLFTIVNLIDNRVFPSYFKYAHRYCGPKKTPYGYEFKGSSNEAELHHLLRSTMMIRRKKRDVFRDLPRKLRRVVPFDIDNRTEYDALAKGGLNLNKLELLKQLAVKGKMNAMIEWIQDMLKTEDKLVIFADHKSTIDTLMEVFGDIAVAVDGRTSDKKREEAKDKFQRCKRCGVRKEKHEYDDKACKEYVPDLKTRIYLGTSAAREGNTLTAAEHVIFTELWWSPKDHDQAEDRCYGRAGDLHGATSWYLVAGGTIEDMIARVYDIKNMQLEKVMDGRELTEEELLTELIKQYKEAA